LLKTYIDKNEDEIYQDEIEKIEKILKEFEVELDEHDGEFADEEDGRTWIDKLKFWKRKS